MYFLNPLIILIVTCTFSDSVCVASLIVTPAMKNVRKRRFRKTKTKKVRGNKGCVAGTRGQAHDDMVLVGIEGRSYEG